MAKSKSKATITVADGSGGMMKVEDRRFERGDWPIEFEIQVDKEQADRWPRHLAAGFHRRGWSSSSLGQLERPENSGSITVIASGKPQLDIVWERKRNRPLKVQARLSSSSDISITEAEQFFTEINDNCAGAVSETIYARGTLHYDGLAWRGELWLDDKVRLAPPSLQDESAILGPRVVHVDIMLDCVGRPDVPWALRQTLLEISAFLGVVTYKVFHLPDTGRAWVWTADGGCEVRTLGYLEKTNPLAMPVRGTDKPVSLYPVDSPPIGIDGSTNEISLRDDIVDLWKLYSNLTTEQRSVFLQAAAKWQEAIIHWQDRPSLSFSLMAVACEALKPSDADDRQNFYDVIETLLGRPAVDRIRQNVFSVHRIRNTHLHTGQFLGSEFVMMEYLSSYHDPSFREAHREMFRVTPAVIIEWLMRRGTFRMPPVNQQKTTLRWIRGKVVLALAVVFGVGLVAGWLLHKFWR